MSIEESLRHIVRTEVRDVLREELHAVVSTLHPAPRAAPADLVSTAEAARIASVTAATIRTWVHNGTLTPHWAGRVLRVSRAELLGVMRGDVTRDAAKVVDLDARAQEIAARIGQRKGA